MEHVIKNYLGQHIHSGNIQLLLQSFNEVPEIEKFEEDEIYYYTYLKNNIEFVFNLKDELIHVHLFSKSSDRPIEQHTMLPSGITFSDTRKVIEEKLGEPDRKGSGHIRYWCEWPTRGIMVTYQSENIHDLQNCIHHITVFEPLQ